MLLLWRLAFEYFQLLRFFFKFSRVFFYNSPVSSRVNCREISVPTKTKMANFFQKSCCNFSRFWIASTNLFTSKTSLKYPLCTSFMLNPFGCKRYIHLHRPFYNLLTPGVGHRRPCVKWIHTTRTGFSIEEFFPPGVLETQQPLPEEVKSGIEINKI